MKVWNVFGFAGVLALFVSLGLPEFAHLPLTQSFLLSVAAFLGVLAATKASKWWLLLPAVVISLIGFWLYVIAHAEQSSRIDPMTRSPDFLRLSASPWLNILFHA